MNVDVNNLDRIYNPPAIEYSVPRKKVEEALQGRTFRENEPPYTQEEQERLKRDDQEVWNAVAGSYKQEGPKVAIFTAGGPGAGKTFLLNKLRDPKLPYIDFDDVALKGMKLTYVAEKDPSVKAYKKWRPGSHYVTHTVTANLSQEGYSFYFGTTSTSPLTKNTYKRLKDLGYSIKIIHLSAPDDVRIQSIKKREETWVQSTAEDAIIKGGILLPQRINDTYLKYADQIDFYWRGAADQGAGLAATWTPEKGIQVLNAEIYQQIKKLHDKQVRALTAADFEKPEDFAKKEDLLWERSVEAKK